MSAVESNVLLLSFAPFFCVFVLPLKWTNRFFFFACSVAGAHSSWFKLQDVDNESARDGVQSEMYWINSVYYSWSFPSDSHWLTSFHRWNDEISMKSFQQRNESKVGEKKNHMKKIRIKHTHTHTKQKLDSQWRGRKKTKHQQTFSIKFK